MGGLYRERGSAAYIRIDPAVHIASAIDADANYLSEKQEVMNMGMVKEFKEFALNGNMVDMAVGIIMGGAIGGLVSSLIENMINPIIGMFTGGTDFGSMTAKIGEKVEVIDGADVVSPLLLKYGAFLASFINFLVLAFVIFMIAKMVNNAKKRMGVSDPEAGPSEVDLLTEIRDSLRK